MPAQAIHHLNIRAGKVLIAELKDFYEGVLGLKAGWRPPFESTGHWMYLDETPILHLVEDEMVQESPHPRGPIIDHVAFSSTGLREYEELLKARNIPFRRTKVPETTLVQLIFLDPSGNGVELQFTGTDG
jgi:catechol 2,3-dioxygenase-like lactoylglutathione lyase family enzyme